MTRRVVYTALIGGYERLLEQPVAAGSEVAFVCFTDDPGLTSSTWDVRLVEPPQPGDPVRSARTLKIRGHSDLDDYDETLWIDNSVLLTVDPARILDDWLAATDLAIPAHSFRSTIGAEFDAVMNEGFDDPERLGAQLATYAELFPGWLEHRALWTGMLARRWSDGTRTTMAFWLDEVLRFSRRDQLSIGSALARSGQAVRVVEIDNNASPLHRWPVTDGRRDRDRSPQRPLESEHQQLVRLRGVVDELSLQLNRSVEQREQLLRDVLSSRSWRMTRGLRTAADVARRVKRRARRSG